MAFKLTRIDELTRGEHYYLEQDDACYFFGEYTSRKGYSFSETNQLIANFKKPLSTKGTPQWPHKLSAIAKIGQLYRKLKLPNDGDGIVLVPAPPSKARSDSLYDDRMYQALEQARCFDVRKLVVQTRTRLPSHACGSGERPRISDLLSLYEIDESLTDPTPKGIFICDDVLTNGTTFKSMQSILRSRFPKALIGGIFVARRALGADDSDDFLAIED